MSNETPPNVKIYDRPEKKGPPPILVALFVLIALGVGFFIYRAFSAQPAAAPAPASQSSSYRPSDIRQSGTHSVRISPQRVNFS
ncbi:MAG: hypothetical protein V4671_11815 [Armatimonadota bacterium]